MWGSCRSVLPCSAVGGLSGKRMKAGLLSFKGCQIWNDSLISQDEIQWVKLYSKALIQRPRPKVLAHETNLEFKRRADCLIIYLFVFYIPCTEKEVHNLLRMWPKSNGVNVLNTVWADLAGYPTWGALKQLLETPTRFRMVQQCKASSYHKVSVLPLHRSGGDICPPIIFPMPWQQQDEGKHQKTGRLLLPLYLATSRASNLFGIRRSASRTSNWRFNCSMLQTLPMYSYNMLQYLRSSENSMPHASWTEKGKTKQLVAADVTLLRIAYRSRC